jgi:transposase-like protein
MLEGGTSMAIPKEILDELLKDYKGPEDITGENGLLKQLTKALIERAMQAELTEELGYEKNQKGGSRQPIGETVPTAKPSEATWDLWR